MGPEDFHMTHLENLPELAARPQQHNERIAAARIKELYRTPDRLVLYTRYDPGLVLRRHWHLGDEVVHVLEGEVTVSGVSCKTGATLLFAEGKPFGPLIAGPQGTTILEVFFGPNASQSVGPDDEGFRALLAERGIVDLGAQPVQTAP